MTLGFSLGLIKYLGKDFILCEKLYAYRAYLVQKQNNHVGTVGI